MKIRYDKRMRYAIVIILTIILGFGVWYVRFFRAPVFPNSQNTSMSTSPTNNDTTRVTLIAEKLDTPWAVAFLPDSSLLVTERSGRVRLIQNNQLSPTPIITLSQVREIGEAGLLGIAIDPQFSDNNFIYLYYTYDGSSTTVLNRIVRMVYRDKALTDEKILVDAIPSSSNHAGGRIKFGPDGFLYITTGDAEEPSEAQDRNTLNGKILRITRDGEVVPGNPFGTFVYSYGHRNPQGITWDAAGNLWSTEHGRSGFASGLDEINLIIAGNNYGWPVIQGSETRNEMKTPIANSGNATWAPSGIAYLNGSLYFSGLRGQALYKAELDGTNIKSIKDYLKGEFGRIRDVVVGPDNMLYITTSNNDGRGVPANGDDKIIKINPQKL